MSSQIQEHFGEAIIEAMASFAKRDLRSVNSLTLTEFSHVTDPKLRQALAETLYGARWIYKLGLALLVKNEEQMAHVRAQVLDFGSVCEGLLSDSIFHGLDRAILIGQKYRYADTANSRRPINWTVQNKLSQMMKQSFHWHIEIAEEEGIVSAPLAARLHAMRRERNTIHLRARTHQAFLGTSKSLFGIVTDTIAATKAWRTANP